MGFHSWLTSDTQESVPNIYSNKYMKNPKTVYLLVPKKGIKIGNKIIKENIPEPKYEGYGSFNGHNAYSLLFYMNKENINQDILPYKDLINEENEQEIEFSIGLMLDLDRAYKVKTEKTPTYIITKDILSTYLQKDKMRCKIIEAPFDYEMKIPEYNKSLNQLIAEKIVEPIPIRNIILKNPEKYKPLKFSFNKNAVYEELPASESDPAQGYFY